MIDYKALLLSPKGRIGRQTFFTAAVGLVAANFVLNLVPFLGPILVLPLLWPFACVTAKRLHDAGRSAWPVAIVTLMCLATGAMAAAIGVVASNPATALSAFAMAGMVVMLGGFTTVAALALLVWAGVSRSDSGPNRFGKPEVTPLSFGDLIGRESADV
jgi:uncharacterized membrane protein YhaH (DUF805 family)